MGVKIFYLAFIVFGCVSAQSPPFRVCTKASNSVCQSLDKDGSQAVCQQVESRVDCALLLASGSAELGVFTEEETLLLAQLQPNDHRVVATIRDVQRLEPFAFEAVTVVRSTHTGGLEGLQGGRYCHPGLSEPDLRWSPRVLKTLERLAARTDRCPDVVTDSKTAEEVEVETLSKFFSEACRPGPWSSNETVDADLKRRFPNLCTLCGQASGCERYSLDMISIAGTSVNNRHVQALECLRTNGTVAYVAWQHAREFFTVRNPDEASSYSLLCEDGSLQPLTPEALAGATAPCSLIRQPWKTILAPAASALRVQVSLRQWWPGGASPGGSSWQGVLFSEVVGGASALVVFEEGVPTVTNYTSAVRNITSLEGSSTCLPARRWCTLSEREHTKCTWARAAAHSLGIEPGIACQQRATVFDCLRDVRDNRADFIATPANYGFISRQHYKLSPVKLVQNSRLNPAAFSRVAALVKETGGEEQVTRFENLRDKRACFPEFGGIAYMSFVRAAHERSVISATGCDYARAVGEFFSGACAGGAVDASHAISETTYNATNLCTVCRPAVTVAGNADNFTCAWDSTNQYFGNRGALACLADPDTHVAFVEIENMKAHIAALNLNSSNYRALCRNNSLAADTGFDVDPDCLLAYVVDSEVLARRNDPNLNSLNTLLDTLDEYFGYNSATASQFINFALYSPFGGASDLLFRDTAVGLAEPSRAADNEAARNYIDLFQHLEACTAAAPSSGGRNWSMLSVFVTVVLSSFVV